MCVIEDNPGVTYERIKHILDRRNENINGLTSTYLAILIYNGNIIRKEDGTFYVNKEQHCLAERKLKGGTLRDYRPPKGKPPSEPHDGIMITNNPSGVDLDNLITGLKPCPRCKSRNLTKNYGALSNDTSGYFILCRDCGEYAEHLDADELVSQWNGRERE